MVAASDPRNLYAAIDPQTGFSRIMSCVGSTQPGDGAAVRVVVGAPSWKEKVIGYAKRTRGTMLRKVRVQVWLPLHPVLIFVGANCDSPKPRNTERRSWRVELPSVT